MRRGLGLEFGLALEIAFNHPAILLEERLVGERCRRFCFRSRRRLDLEGTNTRAQRFYVLGIETRQAVDLFDHLQLSLELFADNRFSPDAGCGSRIDRPLRYQALEDAERDSGHIRNRVFRIAATPQRTAQSSTGDERCPAELR